MLDCLGEQSDVHFNKLNPAHVPFVWANNPTRIAICKELNLARVQLFGFGWTIRRLSGYAMGHSGKNLRSYISNKGIYLH